MSRALDDNGPALGLDRCPFCGRDLAGRKTANHIGACDRAKEWSA